MKKKFLSLFTILLLSVLVSCASKDLEVEESTKKENKRLNQLKSLEQRFNATAQLTYSRQSFKSLYEVQAHIKNHENRIVGTGLIEDIYLSEGSPYILLNVYLGEDYDFLLPLKVTNNQFSKLPEKYNQIAFVAEILDEGISVINKVFITSKTEHEFNWNVKGKLLYFENLDVNS